MGLQCECAWGGGGGGCSYTFKIGRQGKGRPDAGRVSVCEEPGTSNFKYGCL